VDSRYEKLLAEDIASRIEGVAAVENHLAIRPVTDKADWEIREDLYDRLLWNPLVDNSDITVHVTHGVATLEGVVDTWIERRVATDAAFEVGAKRVQNRVQVREGPPSYRP
jgi:osmotically-inducible protein OsmY